MLDLRLSIVPNIEDAYWYVHLGELPFHQYLRNQMEIPCDLEALLESSKGDGIYCLFRCICGYRWCDSFWVEVKHKKDELHWGKAYGHDEAGERGDLIGKVDWSFKQSEYIWTITKAIQLTEVASRKIRETEPES